MGTVGATCPITLKLWGRRPPNFGDKKVIILVLFVFARKLGPLPKIVGQTREVFSFG